MPLVITQPQTTYVSVAADVSTHETTKDHRSDGASKNSNPISRPSANGRRPLREPGESREPREPCFVWWALEDSNL
jgi:hypothetical protein